MDSLQHYSSANLRTSLELEGDRKVIVIDHPEHGKHRFLLPTKEEIFNDYGESGSSESGSKRKKWCNSFMIFRTYLHRSKSSLDLKGVSKFAKDAWRHATNDVIEACNELEAVSKENFKYNTFLPYEISKGSKNSKKTTTR